MIVIIGSIAAIALAIATLTVTTVALVQGRRPHRRHGGAS